MGHKNAGMGKTNNIQCANCGKKLAEAEIKEGYVSIKCKCGATNLVIVTKEKAEIAPPKEKKEYGENPGARY